MEIITIQENDSFVSFQEIKRETMLTNNSNSNLKVYVRGFVQGIYIEDWTEYNSFDIIKPNAFRFKSLFDRRPRIANLAILDMSKKTGHKIELEYNSNGERFVIKDREGLNKALNINVTLNCGIKDSKFAINAANNKKLSSDFLKSNGVYSGYIKNIESKLKEIVCKILNVNNQFSQDIAGSIKKEFEMQISNDCICKILDISNIEIQIERTEEGLSESQKNENREIKESSRITTNKEIKGLEIEAEGENTIKQQEVTDMLNEMLRISGIKDTETEAKKTIIEAKADAEAESYTPIVKRIFDFIDKNPDALKTIAELINRNSSSILGNKAQNIQILLNLIGELSNSPKALVNENTDDEVYE